MSVNESSKHSLHVWTIYVIFLTCLEKFDIFFQNTIKSFKQILISLFTFKKFCNMLFTLLFFKIRIMTLEHVLQLRRIKTVFELSALLVFCYRNEICLLLLLQMSVMEFICAENKMLVWIFVKKVLSELPHVFLVLSRYYISLQMDVAQDFA